MSTQNSSSAISTVSLPPRRTRSERVALRSTSQGSFAQFVAELKRNHWGYFLLVMFLTSVGISCLIEAWNPPFSFRSNTVADRAIVCRTTFSVVSLEATRIAKERASWESLHVFANDPKPLIQLRESLWNTVAAMVNAQSFDQLDEKGKETWYLFLKPSGKGTIPENVDPRVAFEAFVAYFKDDTSFDLFNNCLKRVFTPFELHGTLRALHYGAEQGSQDQILVYPKGESLDHAVPFKVSEVLIRDGTRFKEALQRELKNPTLVDQLFNWLSPKLEETLKEDQNATADLERKAAEAVKEISVEFVPGQVIIEQGRILGAEEIALLRAEYNAFLLKFSPSNRIFRFQAVWGTIFILIIIAWGFVQRLERRRPKSPLSFAVLMGGMVMAVAVAQGIQRFSLTIAEGEIIPILLFVMVVSITYSWELAIVLSTILTLILVFGNGGGNDLLMILLCVTVSSAIQLGRLRSRKKLVVVSFLSGIVAFVLTVTTGALNNSLLETTVPVLETSTTAVTTTTTTTTGVLNNPLLGTLFLDAFFNFVWSCLAGLIMTGILPFIEEPFGILTDMSLLELGDVSQPLLQSLIRLAPATYGHSMQVGTIAETAAEAIGARGLLTRVGAYFHDIGKIMKPEYFSENQGGLDNIHDHIEPQVSTIVLIAHVKDGIDLARQHRLPKPLIDLIEQHHGTSLVSFFYGRAAKGNKDEPSKQVEESTYRYPGPKPQTKEAAILMIADTCESACRSMGTAATPGKVENRVHVLIKQKLDDGQFDDSGLTLRELKIIENSVIKSIIAAMHGRIKYPDQETEQTTKISESEPTQSKV
ncbi:MAG: HDIG domain-containing protein [Planctomycetaceae bacterium]|jgi:putative nucleotidyltransferase with HDIG domain|nr:HDIG domain-containing protein [Planctomycetaceae bacterium]